jgi:hypothetical protein
MRVAVAINAKGNNQICKNIVSAPFDQNHSGRISATNK